MEKRTKAKAETGIYLLIVAAILVVANIISFRTYKRFDVTKTERYSLSKGSARLVEGLSKDLDITLYVTRGLPKHEVFIQELTDLLNEYERAGHGKMHYVVIEPKVLQGKCATPLDAQQLALACRIDGGEIYPGAESRGACESKAVSDPCTVDEKKIAKDDGLQEAAFGEGSKTGKDQALISKGFMGMSFKYGAEKEAIPIMSPEQSTGLEFWITNKIREIRDRADNKFQKIGILTGKDEIKLSDANLVAAGGGRGGGPTMKGIMEQALPFYKFEDVDLQNGDAEINKELVGVILTQPGKDYTEKELRRIDQFLMLGNKALAVFASAVNIKASDASLKAELNLHGLDKLLEGYGVEMKKDAVFEWVRPAVMRVMTQGGPVVAALPAAVLAVHDGRADDATQFLDHNFACFFRMDEMVFPFSSTLITHPDKQPGATIKVVARTTSAATAATGDTVEMKIARGQPKPSGDAGQRAIAVSLEGKLRSAFGGKSGDGIETSAESKDKSRVLVISSSQFLANPFARAGNAPPMPPQLQMMGPMGGDEELQMISQPYAQQYLTGTILAFKNTLDWMGGDSDLIAASAKLNGESNLTYLDIEKPKGTVTDQDAANKQAEEFDAKISSVQTRVQWTMIILPAVLFVLLGLLRWRLRESARGAITLN